MPIDPRKLAFGFGARSCPGEYCLELLKICGLVDDRIMQAPNLRKGGCLSTWRAYWQAVRFLRSAILARWMAPEISCSRRGLQGVKASAIGYATTKFPPEVISTYSNVISRRDETLQQQSYTKEKNINIRTVIQFIQSDRYEYLQGLHYVVSMFSSQSL